MQRRTLSFRVHDDVMAEVLRLRSGGCAQLGKLDLAQICTHLADTTDGYIDGFAFATPWWVRYLFAPVARRVVLWFNWMPTGIRVPDHFMPPTGGDVDAAIERLRRSLERFDAHRGPFAPHPFLGRLTPAQYRRLSLLHCAHHLGFLIPNSAVPHPATTPHS